MAVIKPRLDVADRVEAQLRVMMAGARAEPGCAHMELVASADDPDTWIMLEKFHSRRDWDDHMLTDHVKQGNALLDGLLREPTELRFYTEK